MKAKQIAAALLTGIFVSLFGRLFAGAKSAEKELESYDSGSSRLSKNYAANEK